MDPTINGPLPYFSSIYSNRKDLLLPKYSGIMGYYALCTVISSIK
jgi:hypothetical protein